MIKALLCVILLLTPYHSMAAIDWNDNEIEWYGYKDGIDKMLSERKNGILVVYSDSCSVCVKYAKMFKNKDVIASSRSLVMIRVDRASADRLGSKYKVKGNYVPRTYLLDSKANILPSPYKNDKYIYYLPPDSEIYLAGLMKRLAVE